MTTSPARPLVHAYEGENPFDIVDSAWGSIERWRAQALHTGEVSGLTTIADHVRSDAITRLDAIEARETQLSARQDALDQRERGLGVIAAQIADLAGRASVVWDRIERARADATEEPIAHPPGNDEAPEPKSKEPEPSLELEDDAIAGTSPGDLDLELNSHGEFLRKVPDQAEFPDPELPHPPVVEQPISVGLDEE